LTIRTLDLRTELTFDRISGHLTRAEVDGTRYITESQWEVINEGVQTLQNTLTPDQDNPSQRSHRSKQTDLFNVTYELDFLGDSQIIKVYSQTVRTAPSSGTNPAQESYLLTGRTDERAPHFARNQTRIKVPPTLRDQKYTLDIFDNETSTTVGFNSTPRQFSGGPVTMSADGLVGVGVYSFGPRLLPNPRTSRWARSEELSPLEEWQDGHAAPKGIHHDTRFLVLGDAQEVFDKFTDLHNHHMAEQYLRTKNAVRLDAPVS